MTMLSSLNVKVRFLSNPASFPDPPQRIVVSETHMSWVFMADDWVLKLKKPVKRPFLDFSTIEARHFFCCEEVRLNRRLAYETYRGVKPLYADLSGNLNFEERGSVVDWLVEMRRLPEGDMLDHRIKKRDLTPTELFDVADKLVRFYAQCQPQTADDYVRNLLEEHDRTRKILLRPAFELVTGNIPALIEDVTWGLQQMRSTIEERIKMGNLVEGHGDLRPEHICLARPPQIIDCLEFNRAMRLIDPYDEISYLALECEALGADWVGPTFLCALERTFGNRPSDRLLAVYGGFRAMLRARICLVHLLETPLREPDKWRPLALTYLEIAKARMSRFVI